MDKIIVRIITNTAPRHIQSRVFNGFGMHSFNSYVNCPALHVKAVLCNPVIMSAQLGIGKR
jgi:hypothetical protein